MCDYSAYARRRLLCSELCGHNVRLPSGTRTELNFPDVTCTHGEQLLTGLGPASMQGNTVYMLGAKYGFAQSMDLYFVRAIHGFRVHE